MTNVIVLDNVSKFYGEVLGVNKVNLTIPAGVTSLVGPNGSGKTTLMNLIAGLLQPTRGRLTVCGLSPNDPETYFRTVGYATQYDGFPRGLTGWLERMQARRSAILVERFADRLCRSKTAGAQGRIPPQYFVLADQDVRMTVAVQIDHPEV